MTESDSESAAEPKRKKKVNRGARMGKGPGRPTKRTALDVAHAKQLAAEGKSIPEIAEVIGVAPSTVYAWHHDNEQFRNAIEKGKEIADGKVERSLFDLATGYEQDEEKLFCFMGEIVRGTTRKKVGPSFAAISFYLRNRCPDKWKEKQEVEHSGGVDLMAGLAMCRARAGLNDDQASPEGGAE